MRRLPASTLAARIAPLALAVGMDACTSRPSVDVTQVFRDPAVAALAVAAARGDSVEVHRLVRDGADPNARGDKGVTLTQWALLNRSVPGMVALVQAGSNPALADSAGETAVHYAAKANDPRYLEALLRAGADPNTPHGVTRAPPLMAALMGNRETQFRALIATGADPDRADRMGDRPIHLAAQINATRRILDLLEAGADPGAVNGRGNTFQRYLDITPREILSDEARRGRDEIAAWIRAHPRPVERQR